ncbi:MAG: hypothetical protein IT459_16640, partial [Planctomycetes bacterium]|nr:hypothetical protein [Planctomycetota bacterium]
MFSNHDRTPRRGRGAGWWLAAASMFGVGPLATSSVAQSPAPCQNAGVTTNIAYVDATFGVDFIGQINNSQLPFLTVNGAIQGLVAQIPAATGSPLGATNRGLVIINPGIYSVQTTGETFPITMVDWIDVQGIGAKEVIIQGDGSTLASAPFVPLDLNGDCTCGVRFPGFEVLFDFSGLTNLAYDEMLDAVTLRGSYIQVYAESANGPIFGRISNCVFDLLDRSNQPTPLIGPWFGILMVHPWLGATYVDPTHDPDPPEREEPGEGGEPPHDPPPTGPTAGGSIDAGYADVYLNIFNNTMIQTWEPTPSAPSGLSAATHNVAICDVTDPRCDLGAAGDTEDRLRGVGNPNIQSNLIRAYDATPPTSMLGIDITDVTCQIGTNAGPSNAFDPSVVGPQSGPFQGTMNPAFCSLLSIGGMIQPTVPPFAPVPRSVPISPSAFPFPVPSPYPLNPNGLTAGLDPAFVGELLTLSAAPVGVGYDWRLVPDSFLVNAGTGPLNQLLRAVNQTQHVDIGCPFSSFDFDGEGYGNPRVQATLATTLNTLPAGPEVDIGFDETGILIDCGMANDSVIHSSPATLAGLAGQLFVPPVATALGAHIYMYPQVGFHTLIGPNPLPPPPA